MENKELMHLLRRATYGPSKTQIDKYNNLSRKDIINDLIDTSRKNIEYLDVIQPEMQKFIDYASANKGNGNDYTDLDKDELRKMALAHFYQLRSAWLEEMLVSDKQLNEKMALFWHNHFATNEKRDIVGQQKLLFDIRKNALGSFGDLLKSVSKSSVMIYYLNTQQNTKKSPNENFARELCELFTLGRDKGYNEGDIKEIARCFTTWKAIRTTGTFVELKRGGDEGQKQIFGQRGNFSGDDVLNMILNKKETASFIVAKIYKYFVNPQINEARVNQLADKFYSSGYDIASLMKEIFSNDWFYEKNNLGSLIKSPIELVLNIHCQTGLGTFQKNKSIFALKALQQTIFDLPNVGGWPHDRQWIDSSSLLFRLQLPSIIILNEALQVSVKENNDDTGGEVAKDAMIKKENKQKLIRQRLNKGMFGTEGKLSFSIPVIEDGNKNLLSDYFLAVTPRIKLENLASTDALIQKQAVVNLMSTPEYQLI
jgi:uncharacterized protein (DUF1800 family)